MKVYQIAVLPGDGIGKDVIAEGLKTLNLVAEVDGGRQAIHLVPGSRGLRPTRSSARAAICVP